MPEGLRVVNIASDTEVAYCGIAVKTGTRNETAAQHGLAHFCEHLAFKGTSRRHAVQIINAIEGVGGELNAFTNKEDTVFYCVVQQEYLPRAVDVLCDIVFCSEHPQTEVEKESEVVCDEIESYEDSPAELIYDEIENILFEGHPLGHNILGTAEQIRRYTNTDTKAFARQWYKPENCVLFVTGKEPLPATKPTTPLAQTRPSAATLPESKPALIVRQRHTHQAHVMLGTTAYSVGDSRRWALYLLNNILGGPGMNSRLNMALRERNGLVYTVESSMTCYSDTGLWTVYFGCDRHDIKRCCRMVRHQLDLLMEKPLQATRLKAAKKQLQGQLAIACDNREQFALDFARNYLHTGRERHLADINRHIEALTPADLQLTAQAVFDPERITTLIYE